jgi:hypothetical protein
MRHTLKQIEDLRSTFSGTFVRFGQKNGWEGRVETTILLKDITDSHGGVVCDHLWFNLTKQFNCLGLKENDKVEFCARVKEYTKGYKGWNEERQMERPIQRDYKLSHPTKVKLLNRAPENSTEQKLEV